MIENFKCKKTEKLSQHQHVKKFSNIERPALKKLTMMNAAKELADLKCPPGNNLEALQGDRLGQYSIRINSQYRICFTCKDNKFYDVEIVYYHG